MADRVALITGATRGLGRSMARHLAEGGACVIGTYHRSRDDADELVAEIAEAGGRATALHLDVRRSDSFADFAAAVQRTLRGTFHRETFDYLVNNAGGGIYAPFPQTTEEQFDDAVRLGLKAPFFLSQALLPLIADGGRILNVSSGLTRFVGAGHAAYAAAKGGVEVLTRYMAVELGERQIRVNTVAPGAIETDFDGGAVRDNPELNQKIAAATALGRVGLADDIGSGAAAILSDGFGRASGSRIELSGGQNL